MGELISVIVPVYNAEKYLKKCIDSIINQTYKNLEIILIDDGSSDNCGQICDKYAELDYRVKVVHKENEGVSVARNLGVSIANGEYLGFVDSDDWIEENMFELLYNAAKKYSVKLCCAGKYVVKEKIKNKICYNKEEVLSAEGMLVKIFKQKECDISMCDKLYHHSLFVDIEFPMGKRHEELAIIHKVIFLAGQCAVLDTAVYNYRRNEDSFTSQRFSKENIELLLYADSVVEFCREKYPRIVKQAVSYSAKKRLELCIKICNMKNLSLEERKIKKELMRDLYLNKSQLTAFDKTRYLVLRTGLYGFVSSFAKKHIARK